MLIDEAQDTNPDQWRIVRVLADEFFAGRGQRTEGSRTVFAVGDAKQSIYSFQRADPRAFEEMRHRLAAQIPAAGGKWDEVALSVSFRSTKAVLDAVDAVIASPGGRIGVLAEGEVIEHRPHRSGAAGLVEIWPPVEPKLVDETDAWKPPINPVQGDSPRGRLARLMALRIKAMLDHGERLESKGQPIRPGDIMVLVRRRGAFVEELVKALKQLEIPVAGADRMILTEQLAVMDLMALANAVLLPEDNLTLATLLKSPLLGLSETALFTLAHGRSGSLWDALRQRRNDPTYAEAWDRLSEWLALADRVTPHEFFAHVLENGGKQRLLTRLGMEAEDPLDEFMSLTLAHERLHPPSLQAFLHWLEEGGVEIKRDMEGGVNAVRIMTVHGSKGLQAPIVFLPDTLQAPSKSPGLFWLDEGERELLAWPPRSADQDETCRTARDAANQARDQEYRRLLYVAMTRAEDRLYVCGWHTRKEAPAHCWYYLIREALQDRDDVTEEIDGFLASRPEADGEGKVLRLRCPQTADLPPPKNQADTQASQTLPAWARQAAPVESSPPRPLAPSRPDGDEPAPRSPFGGDDGARFRRGRLIHRLLQSLPDLPTHKRAQAAAHFLGRPAWELSRGQQAEIASEVAAVLADPLFGPIFGPASRAEVPVVGMVGERVISGQVDRLLVTDDSVLIVDYKTNRPPPLDPRDVAPIYLRQMAAYRAALACIYPGKRIRCALLWTDGPRLMPLDGAMLDDALAGLLGV